MTEFTFEYEEGDVLFFWESEASEFHVVTATAVTAEFVMVGTKSKQVKRLSYPIKLHLLLFPGLTILSLKQKTK